MNFTIRAITLDLDDGVKVNYGKFGDFNFVRTMQKIIQTPMDIKQTYQIKKLVEEVSKAQTQIQTEYRDTIESVFAKKEDGKLVTPPEGSDVRFVIVEGKEEEYSAAEKAFSEKKIFINRFKLPAEALSSVKLSVAELTAIDPIIDWGDET